MSDERFRLLMENLPAIITALLTALPAVAAFVQSMRNLREIKTVRKEINGRVDQLIVTKEHVAHTEGRASGFAEAMMNWNTGPPPGPPTPQPEPPTQDGPAP